MKNVGFSAVDLLLAKGDINLLLRSRVEALCEIFPDHELLASTLVLSKIDRLDSEQAYKNYLSLLDKESFLPKTRGESAIWAFMFSATREGRTSSAANQLDAMRPALEAIRAWERHERLLQGVAHAEIIWRGMMIYGFSGAALRLADVQAERLGPDTEAGKSWKDRAQRSRNFQLRIPQLADEFLDRP